MQIEQVVRELVGRHGRLGRDIADVRGGDDLRALGLNSHATVNVMLAVEDEFAIEFPDRLLATSTFATLDSLTEAVRSLLVPNRGR